MAFSAGEWRPNPKQELFLSLPWSIREASYAGGAGSGKSDVLLVYPLAHNLHENPNFKQVFMRRTYPELRNEIVPRSRELYLKFGATFNRTEMIWTFPRPDQLGGTGLGNQGAIIKLGHCEDEKDVHDYDSMEINLFTPDEITSFTKWIYLYIGFTRVRTSDPSLPAIIRSAGMPGNIGHTWFKKRFVDPNPKGGEILKDKAGNKRIYIHATLADNKHIDPTYAQSLEALPEAEKKAKKHGDWSAFVGQVFDEFRDKRYPDEPENAIHTCLPFEIPAYWPRLVIGDWGYAAMCWVGFVAISPNKRIYVYREMHWYKTKISVWAQEIKPFIELENPRAIKFCKSAGQDRGQDHTIQSQIEEELERPIELSASGAGSRVAGKMLVHEYMRWKPKNPPPDIDMVYDEEKALWLLRNRGEKEYDSYLNLFKPFEAENNIPRLQIFKCEEDLHVGHVECCPVLIEAIKACVYAKPKDDKPAEDVAEFDGDDPYDGLRYICDSAEAYFEEAKEEFEAVQKRQELEARLQQTQDMTAFYRNARALESTNKHAPVSRYHGRRR